MLPRTAPRRRTQFPVGRLPGFRYVPVPGAPRTLRCVEEIYPMNKFSVLALAAAVLTASCAGHSVSSAVPQLSSGVGGPAHKMSAGAPSGWATTGTQAVNLANAVDLGNLPAAQQLTVRVGLALRNQSQLQAAVASGQTVDPSTFMATYAPTSAQVAQVTN